MRRDAATPGLDLDTLVVAIHSIRGVGWSALTSLLRGMAVQRLAPDDLLHLGADDLRSRFGIPDREASAIAAAIRAPHPGVRSAAERLRRLGGSVITLLDAAYPARLSRWMRPSPPVLYCHGNAALLTSPLIAVANSNAAPVEAVQTTNAAIAMALEAGFAPVTGHNRPEYQQAALVARRRAAPVCYVLDRGLVATLENRHDAALFHAARIWPSDTQARDLVLSTCPPATSGAVGANRLRDATVIALATAIVTAHVRPGGGMCRLLEQAIRAGRPVAWLGDPAATPVDLDGGPLAALDAQDDAGVSGWLAACLATEARTIAAE